MVKKYIYKILRWAEKITYKIFKEEIDEEVFEEMNEMYSKFVKLQTETLKKEKNEKILSDIRNNQR